MEKLANQGNLSACCYDMGSLLWIKWETLGVGFNVNCFRFLERKWLNCSYGRMTENAFDPLSLPSGVSSTHVLLRQSLQGSQVR